MTGYWSRHRLLPTVILSVAIALIAGLLFVFPYISQQAASYNEQSIYKNSDIDFIAPEPSIEQVQELPGTNGIDRVFPFYLTKTSVSVNGNSRTTTVLLSDQMQNIDITMYNDQRLVERADTVYENAIIVDWQFCKDTSASIGDSVSIAIGGTNLEFRIGAIYETNSIYDGGAILAGISGVQKNTIMQNSKNSGYSGMYVAASDYNKCRSYLLSEYRPQGRLKDRSQFESDDQYQVHYDTIMGSSYSNEITDFRVRENNLSADSNILMIVLGSLLSAILMIIFNVVMAKRGCEKVYFRKHCIPKGIDVKPYYKTSFFAEVVLTILLYAGSLALRISIVKSYIPKSAIGISVVAVPVAVLVAGIICLAIINSSINAMNEAVRAELATKKKQENALEDNSEDSKKESS